MRVVVGAGGRYEPGWIPTDLDSLNLTDSVDWGQLFQTASIDVIFAEHVWEHLTAPEAQTATGYCFRYLKPGGRLRIAVPDGFHPDPSYQEYVRPGGTGPGADDHKALYNHETLSALLREAGFHPHPLEYFDEAGTFHQEKWNSEFGTVKRSARLDERNCDGKLNYTSLIVDGIKPS